VPRLKLSLAYQGTRYAGWQLQAGEGLGYPPSIQGEVERAVALLMGGRVAVHGAGRTDAGVHAEGQVCHLDLPEAKTRVDWKRALNAHLPEDIRILSAEWVESAFHSRKSAVGKRYAYTLWSAWDKAPPRIGPFVWSCPPLDFTALREAIPLLVGRRDFASVRNTGTDCASTVRTLHSIELLPGMAAQLACPPEWPITTLLFEGDGFLKQMVRNLVGLLVRVGQGKLAASAVPGILEARDRAALPCPCAPAQGLTLLEVLYIM
jgi:tRNA pseudouridine38-40 synthase